jgi:predicted ATP-binding protein involved in virulence
MSEDVITAKDVASVTNELFNKKLKMETVTLYASEILESIAGELTTRELLQIIINTKSHKVMCVAYRELLRRYGYAYSAVDC